MSGSVRAKVAVLILNIVARWVGKTKQEKPLPDWFFMIIILLIAWSISLSKEDLFLWAFSEQD